MSEPAPTPPLCIVRDEVDAWAADYMVHCALESQGQRDRFCMALSGGSTPLPLYDRLLQEPYRSRMPWDDSYLFWVDERMVDHASPDSNFGQAHNALIAPLSLNRQQVFPMQHPSLDAKLAAATYTETLKQFFNPPPERLPCFDLIILGVGDDGHTASLFPEEAHSDSGHIWVKEVIGGKPKVPRTTLTFPLLNAARHIVVMATGTTKARVVRQALIERKGNLPIEKIRPLNGRLVWLLDKSAASRLPAAMQATNGT
jgi:6-phosphogluconolactonase